jgi:hypothetical protein
MAPTAWAGATILISNGDGPGVGFNDPTQVEPASGNSAPTIGGQRMAVFQEAARIWGEALDSAVPIVVRASFQNLQCDSNSGVLGQAYSPNIFASDDTSFDAGVPPTVFPRAHTWYVAALSERFAGKKVLSGTGTSNGNYEIVANSTPRSGHRGLSGRRRLVLRLRQPARRPFSISPRWCCTSSGIGLSFTSFDDPTTGAHTNGEPDIWGLLPLRREQREALDRPRTTRSAWPA